MGHHSCCNKQKVRRGLWSPEEDEKLIKYVTAHGHGCWSAVPKQAGLQRCGKSCRLRWINYLRPDLKRGCFSLQEERLIIELHKILGNRWAQIAKHLPGRTDNEVKNFWNSCIKKKLVAQGIDLKTHKFISHSQSQRTEPSFNGQGVVNGMAVVPGSNPMYDFRTNVEFGEIASGSGHFSSLPCAENVNISSYALLPDTWTEKQSCIDKTRCREKILQESILTPEMISKGWPAVYDNHVSMARNNTEFENKYIQAEQKPAPSMPSSNIKAFPSKEPKQFSAQYNPTHFCHPGIDMRIPIYEAMNHDLYTPIVVLNDAQTSAPNFLNPIYPTAKTQLPKLCEMGHAEERNSAINRSDANEIKFSASANCESFEQFDIDLLDSSVTFSIVSECVNHPVTEWNS